FHVLRLLATLSRARRLAESYTERILGLFSTRVEELGRALGIADHAIKVFSEGDIRGHVIFQLSRLVDLGLQTLRQALQLSPWEAIVPGEACGPLVRAQSLPEAEGRPGRVLLLLEQPDGDAETPAGVKGIALGHPLPHLSHLGVRARQARVPFAACADRTHLRELEPLVGKNVRLRVTPEGLSVQEETPGALCNGVAEPASAAISVPDVILAKGPAVLPLDQAEAATCGPKAAGARRLLELAGQAGGLFQAPRGLAIPFGVMERCLDADPTQRRAYDTLLSQLAHATREQLDGQLERLRAVVRALAVP